MVPSKLLKKSRIRDRRGVYNLSDWNHPQYSEGKMLRVFLFAVSRNYMERAITQLKATLEVVEDINEADIVLTLKSRYRKKTNRLREAENRGMPVHVIRSNTYSQVLRFVKDLFGLSDSFEKSGETGLIEAEKAARQVLRENEPIELTPRNSFVRRLQHKIA